jgi:FKBP-type peptidyl-prolyl cis-trans isomerase FkpA
MIMKKINLILPLFLVTFFLGSCIKDKDTCQPKTVESEDAAMISFAATTPYTFTKHSSGMYYYIENPGSGVSPTINSTLSVKYKGTFTNGVVFDEPANAVSFGLSGVIIGWQIGMPLIKKGGKIKLIIPSSYAYGCSANGPIPAYSILYFEIELIDVL